MTFSTKEKKRAPKTERFIEWRLREGGLAVSMKRSIPYSPHNPTRTCSCSSACSRHSSILEVSRSMSARIYASAHEPEAGDICDLSGSVRSPTFLSNMFTLSW